MATQSVSPPMLGSSSGAGKISCTGNKSSPLAGRAAGWPLTGRAAKTYKTGSRLSFHLRWRGPSARASARVVSLLRPSLRTSVYSLRLASSIPLTPLCIFP